MGVLPDTEYFRVGKTGISQFQTFVAYLGGSAIQTVIDNPVTAYRQLVQQYAKDLSGNVVDPRVASKEAGAIFLKNPVGACMSGLGPRLIGVGFKVRELKICVYITRMCALFSYVSAFLTMKQLRHHVCHF